MNIEDERKGKDMVCFSTVKVGKAFQFNNDIYIKIDIDNLACNAVDLLNGSGHFFTPNSTVVLLNAKVVIQNDI